MIIRKTACKSWLKTLFYKKNKKVKKRFAFNSFFYKLPELFIKSIHFMSGKENKIEVEWTIIKALPSLVFDVQLPDDFWWWVVKWYLSWKMRNNFIKLIEWDKVLIELSPYDLTKWRIIFRQK